MIGGLAPEHTLHSDAAAIRALPSVRWVGIGSAAAHVNFVFDHYYSAMLSNTA